MEMWGGLPSEEMKKRILELQNNNVEFEDLWIDAGWYGDCTDCKEHFSGDWSKYTNDWKTNKRIHKNKLLDVKEILNNKNWRIMLWFEPERIPCTCVENVKNIPKIKIGSLRITIIAIKCYIMEMRMH